MIAWAEHNGDWSEYHGDYRWQKLIHAAAAVRFKWPTDAHRALSDALACRAVWRYLTVSSERKRIDAIYEEEQNTHCARFVLRELAQEEYNNRDAKSKYMDRFIKRWWLRKSEPHWAHNLWGRPEVEFAKIFFGESLDRITLRDKVGNVIYIRKKDIPANLKPASYFPKAPWFQRELEPCAAFFGPVRDWPLYDISEMDRISMLYPLRLVSLEIADDEILLTKTKLQKAGFSDKDIATLKPVAERQNPINFVWYYLYKIKKSEINCPISLEI
jgi:hypothetical protein